MKIKIQTTLTLNDTNKFYYEIESIDKYTGDSRYITCNCGLNYPAIELIEGTSNTQSTAWDFSLESPDQIYYYSKGSISSKTDFLTLTSEISSHFSVPNKIILHILLDIVTSFHAIFRRKVPEWASSVREEGHNTHGGSNS